MAQEESNIFGIAQFGIAQCRGAADRGYHQHIIYTDPSKGCPLCVLFFPLNALIGSVEDKVKYVEYIKRFRDEQNGRGRNAVPVV